MSCLFFLWHHRIKPARSLTLPMQRESMLAYLSRDGSWSGAKLKAVKKRGLLSEHSRLWKRLEHLDSLSASRQRFSATGPCGWLKYWYSFLLQSSTSSLMGDTFKAFALACMLSTPWCFRWLPTWWQLAKLQESQVYIAAMISAAEQIWMPCCIVGFYVFTTLVYVLSDWERAGAG